MEFAKSHPTGHVNKCIDAMNNLIWKYNIIALDRLILCMALRTNEGMELLKFLKGHKILQKFHHRFDRYYIGQVYCGDFAKICGLLIIYELYARPFNMIHF